MCVRMYWIYGRVCVNACMGVCACLCGSAHVCVCVRSMYV